MPRTRGWSPGRSARVQPAGPTTGPLLDGIQRLFRFALGQGPSPLPLMGYRSGEARGQCEDPERAGTVAVVQGHPPFDETKTGSTAGRVVPAATGASTAATTSVNTSECFHSRPAASTSANPAGTSKRLAMSEVARPKASSAACREARVRT